MAWRVGIDSGGTFTDVCLFDEDAGRLEVWKVSSTPHDPSEAIAAGASQGLAKVGGRHEDVSYFAHGTTVGTNALIQLRGVRTGLITTSGFRDLLEIARQKRPDLYDFQAEKPTILVDRDLRIDVPERVLHDGRIEIPLDIEAVKAAARQLKEARVEAVVICFLFSFLYPEHERLAREAVLEVFPEAYVSTSADVAPEFREFERLSTAVVNSYLGPVMRRYIDRLAERLAQDRIGASPKLTQSNGGIISFEQASRLPVRTVLSGPSTGVVAAEALAKLAGIDNLITFDMGGTSTDVALMRDGKCELTSEAVVHGYPIKAPMLDIETVGAGGGSIAYVDDGGLLKVGPRSAGAYPGPACYGLGNEEPTVTDANVLLQVLNPGYILGGRMKLDRQLSEAAIRKLAARLGMDVMQTAQGIISVVTANMARAVRLVSVQRGHDPRDYSLVAFGGAGPLHAARLAQELDITRVVVPRYPGIMCAMGLLLTDMRADFSATRLLELSPSGLPEVGAIFERLAGQAGDWFDNEGIQADRQRSARMVDLRYMGQNYELTVPLPDGPITAASLEALSRGFEEVHRRRFGFIAESDPIQLVTFRVEATGLVHKAEFSREADGGPDASAAIIGEREVWLPEFAAFHSCPVYDREKLKPRNVIQGPAIIEQMDATTLVLPGMRATVDPYATIIMEFV